MFEIFKKKIDNVTAADLDKLTRDLLAANQKKIDELNKK